MAVGYHVPVTLMMGFSSIAGKLQITDRIRGFQNSYITITKVCIKKAEGIRLTLDDDSSVIVSKDQHILTAGGWKRADELVKEEWLCGQEENLYFELKNWELSGMLDMVSLESMEEGSFLANKIILASNE